jgi:hypothetical protein
MTRWQKARLDTRGFRAWKRELAFGLAAGTTAIVLLVTFGRDEAAFEEALIVAGSIIGTVLLVPLLELGWNYIKAPDRLLREELSRLGAEVRELGALVRPDARQLRTALREIQEETSDSLRLMDLARERGFFWKMTEPGPRTASWKRHRDFLRGQRDLEDLYESGRLASGEVDRVMQQRAARSVFRRRRDIEDEDRLPEVIAALTDFNSHLEREIRRLVRA